MTVALADPYDVRAVDHESVKGEASVRLKSFWADALRKAAGSTEDGPGTRAEGARRLAARLGELGVEGHRGRPLHPKSIEAWAGGRRQPGADVLFLVARHLDMSLDQYAFGAVRQELDDDLAQQIGELWRRVSVLSDWLLEVGTPLGLDFAERIREMGAERWGRKPSDERIGA